MKASVSALTTATAPDRLTETPPEIAALIPTAARLSLLLAVTETPWKPPIVPGPTPGWFSAAPLGEGSEPFFTRLCERPLASEALSVTIFAARLPSEISSRSFAVEAPASSSSHSLAASFEDLRAMYSPPSISPPMGAPPPALYMTGSPAVKAASPVSV